MAPVTSNPSQTSRLSGPTWPISPTLQSGTWVTLASPGTQTWPSSSSLSALRSKSARANWTPDHCLRTSFVSGSETISPTCCPSTSSSAVPVSSSRAGAVAAMAPAILWAGSTPLGSRQRLTKVERCSAGWSLSERRVAIRRASERSVLSEKFQRSGSWEVMTMSRVKSRWMRSRVCCQEGPVQTVAGCAQRSGCCWVPAEDAGMTLRCGVGRIECWGCREVGVAGCAGVGWLLLGPRLRGDDVAVGLG